MKKASLGISLLLVLGLDSCRSNKSELLPDTRWERIPINKELEPQEEILAFIRPYQEHLNNTLDSSLSYNPNHLDKSDGALNTALGNLMADIVMQQAGPVFSVRTGKSIDMVLLNHGGIRSRLDKGMVSARSAYALMPFENEIVVAQLKGEQVLALLEYLEKGRTAHPVSGICIKMDQEDQITSATIAGQQITPSRTYYVATSDYLVQGGDQMEFFLKAEKVYELDYKLRNAIIDHFRNTDTLRTHRDQRFVRIN